MRGIDVSKWQGRIDWGKVKASGIDFVIIRAGYGKESSQKDIKFETNYAGAKAAGLHVGAYWYSYAKTVEDAAKEAGAFLKVIAGKQLDFPVYIDLEEKEQFSKGKVFCSNVVDTFCKVMEAHGYYAGIYISRSPLQTHIYPHIAQRYALWIAEYNRVCRYDGKYGIWQKSSKGRVPGIEGNVDVDVSYINYPDIIVSKKLNGYSRKSVDSVAREVIDGIWGNGTDRVERIEKAGYDPVQVQRRVNELM